MFGGRLPYVWDQKGPTTDKIADEVRQFLFAQGRHRVSRERVRGPRPRRRVCGSRPHRRVAADGQRRRLRQGAGRAQPIQGDRPARRQARVVLRHRARAADSRAGARRRPGVCRICRARPSPRPPRSRRRVALAGAAKESFDLSAFYANEGALGDSDNNLIPDRVDVLLSGDGDGSEGIIDLGSPVRSRVDGDFAAAGQTGGGHRRAGVRADARAGRHRASARRGVDPQSQMGRTAAAAGRGADPNREERVRREKRGDRHRRRRGRRPPRRAATRRDVSAHLAARQGPHDARRCGGGCAEVRGRPIASRAGGDGTVQARPARGAVAGEGSRRGARQGVRREGGGRIRRRREAAGHGRDQGVGADRRRAESRRPERARADHRRLRGAVGGR